MRALRAALTLPLLALLPACASNDAGPTPSPTPSPGTCGAGAPVQGTPNLTTQRIAQGFIAPVDLRVAPGDRSRLFVVLQGGRIMLLRDGALLAQPFLDIASRVSSGGELGLLGLAFHPQYASNGRFFVNFTNNSGDTHISEFRVTSNPDIADPNSERLLMRVDQPFSNHNGGALDFGNDGKLYIGLGDGGSAGDPFNNAQNLFTRLGKILRIDVDQGQPFGIPADNPFVTQSGTAREVWAFGLRNPWRFAFHRGTGDLYIGDVGQNRREEIDIGLSSTRGGENYGWRITEGTLCFNPSGACGTAGITFPVLEYDHDLGCSVTGGVVYQGCRMPGYQGSYFFGDFCTAFVRSFRFANGQVTDIRDWTSQLGGGIGAVSSFGVDADGELYILDYSDGEIYKVVPVS